MAGLGGRRQAKAGLLAVLQPQAGPHRFSGHKWVGAHIHGHKHGQTKEHTQGLVSSAVGARSWLLPASS